MKISPIVVGMYETNCYLAYDSETMAGVIIDPGDEPERIIDEITKRNFTPVMILLTHGHVDHISGVPMIMDHYDIPLYVSEKEMPLLKSANRNMSALTGHPVTLEKNIHNVTEGETLSFGSVTLKVIETPGHSPGGICFLSGMTLFCGDTLFYGSVGRSDFEGSSHEQLIASITEKLLALPDETICLPGHGPSTTIGQERLQNPFLTGSHFV